MVNCPTAVLFGVNTHSIPAVDHFLRVEWTAAFPLCNLNLAQSDTVHGARCALPLTGNACCTSSRVSVLVLVHKMYNINFYDRIQPVELYQ